jgi:ubiquinone/menaquinone biosynthesis C-methylase UbiE
MLVQSVDNRTVGGVVMPTFPPAEVQQKIHGHANAHSLRESFKFYQLVKQYADYADRPFSPDKTLVDFGCGWGRVARLFMHSIAPPNIVGVEPNSERVAMARQHNPMLCFLQSRRLPPLILRDGSVDYIVAFSVFSHLDEMFANAWINEFARIIKPGGIAFLTTQRRAFVDNCEKARQEIASGAQPDSGWVAAVARSFVDKEAYLKDYDAGIFLHSASGGKPPSLSSGYGETAVAPNYIKKHWAQHFTLLDFVDDSDRLPQAMMVLQRR